MILLNLLPSQRFACSYATIPPQLNTGITLSFYEAVVGESFEVLSAVTLRLCDAV
jgi:hypothetical protein